MPIHRGISCAKELMMIGVHQSYPENGVYTLTKNIRIDAPWKPLRRVRGIEIHGEGYWISGLDAPLFDAIENGIIAHVRLEVDISGDSVGHAGSLARHGERMDIDACETYGRVEGGAVVGGFFGSMVDSDVWGLHNYARATSTDGFCGGICGRGKGNRYRDCWNHGDICSFGSSSPLICAGGIVGEEQPSLRSFEQDKREPFAEFCSNRGAVESFLDAGGIVGRIECAEGDEKTPFTILWCGNFGEITTSQSAESEGGVRFGGIVGHAKRPAFISDCYNQNKICANGYAGGIVGLAENNDGTGERGNGTIENCVNHDLVCGNYGSNIGGIVGAIDNFGGIYSSTNKMTICCGGVNAGGVVGHTRGCEIIHCVNEGYVRGEAGLSGGVAGCADDSQLNDCVNHAEIEGGADIGGIAGHIAAASVEKCVSFGNVRCSGSRAGGLVGFAEGECSIVNCVAAGLRLQAHTEGRRVIGSCSCQVELDNVSDENTLLTVDNSAHGEKKYIEEKIATGDPLCGRRTMHGLSVSDILGIVAKGR